MRTLIEVLRATPLYYVDPESPHGHLKLSDQLQLREGAIIPLSDPVQRSVMIPDGSGHRDMQVMVFWLNEVEYYVDYAQLMVLESLAISTAQA